MKELSTERAIEALYTIRAYYASLTAGYPKGKDCRGIGDVMCSEIANSCLMAIKALEQTEPEKCGDCISRQAAKLKVARVIWKDGDSCNDFHDKCVDCLDDLPSVEPEYGKLMKYNVGGHDACKCSKCNTDLGYPYEGKFCKWCGAKMMEVDE